MRIQSRAECPLTGTERFFTLRKEAGLHFFNDVGLGKWAIADGLYRSSFRDPKNAPVRALIASLILSHKLNDTGHQPCILPRSELGEWERDPKMRGVIEEMRLDLYSIEELELEVKRLTFEDKALQTLRTLRKLEKTPGAGLKIPVYLKTYPGTADLSPDNELCPIGIAYACLPTEIPIVFHSLKDDKLIQPSTTQGDGGRIHITTQGYKVADRILPRPSRRAFVICRFTKEIDTIYDAVYEEVSKSEEINCPAFRAKDIPHIDKIDDRIIFEIRNSTLIIVDITRCNFNVGFEAGFALAYDKPIVWCCNSAEKDSPEWPSTFDIHGQNILFYEFNEMEDFKNKLKHRILAALNRW